jgi:glycosyltransferase involved in cell wall biosynthesis
MSALEDHAELFDYDLAFETFIVEPDQPNARLCGVLTFRGSAPFALRDADGGAYNLALLAFSEDDLARSGQFRFEIGAQTLTPGEAAPISVTIPSELLGLDDPLLLIDFVKEGECWFFDRGRPFHTAWPRRLDEASGTGARRYELLLDHQPRIRADFARLVQSVLAGAENEAAFPCEHELATFYFDLVDLIGYFRHSRLPSGIQRVQMQVLLNARRRVSDRLIIRLVVFSRFADGWVDVPWPLFVRLCDLAIGGGEADDPRWTKTRDEALALLDSDVATTQFEPDAFLVNLGSSWQLRNYLLNLRVLQQERNIRYVPFVYDLIPIVTPEHCVEDLTREFVAWIIGALRHADHFLVASRSTKTDLATVAKFIGADVIDATVIALDGNFRASQQKRARVSGEAPSHEATMRILERNSLEPGKYVLFVSKLESRKNHHLAFRVWLSLIKKYGASAVPKLVCVGEDGWLGYAATAALESSSLLRERVVRLCDVHDAELATLYENCLLALYPSAYEGWGLPVTESLCYGKVPLISSTSSLPEAGGDFAVYFDPQSEANFFTQAERLIYDKDFRRDKESRIESAFAPRSWAAIADQILITMLSLRADDATRRAPAARVPILEPGRFLPLGEARDLCPKPALFDAEILRRGRGWWWPEPWGVWMKPGVAHLTFETRLDEPQEMLIFVKLRGCQRKEAKVEIALVGFALEKTIVLPPDAERWVLFRAPEDGSATARREGGIYEFDIRLVSPTAIDFAEISGGADRRIASIGVVGLIFTGAKDVKTRLAIIENLLAESIEPEVGPLDRATIWEALQDF